MASSQVSDQRRILLELTILAVRPAVQKISCLRVLNSVHVISALVESPIPRCGQIWFACIPAPASVLRDRLQPT